MKNIHFLISFLLLGSLFVDAQNITDYRKQISTSRTTNPYNDLTTANAGYDQVVCYDPAGYTIQLTGNAVNTANNELGTWSAYNGNPSIIQAGTSAFVTLTSTQTGPYKYFYTISNDLCQNTDSVLVTILPEVDLSSVVSGGDVCKSLLSQTPNNAQIVIATPSPGVTYTAKYGSTLASVTATNTSALSINISDTGLPVDGLNTVAIYAGIGGLCPQELLISEFTINKVGIISDVTSDINFCPASTSKARNWEVNSIGATNYDWTPTPFINPVFSNNNKNVNASWGATSGVITVTPLKSDGEACKNLTFTKSINITTCSVLNDFPVYPKKLETNLVLIDTINNYIQGRNISSVCTTSLNDINVIDAYYSFFADNSSVSLNVNVADASWESSMELIDTINFASLSGTCINTIGAGSTQRTYTFNSLTIGEKYEARLELGSKSPLGHSRIAASGNIFSVTKQAEITAIADEILYNPHKTVYKIYNIQGQEVNKAYQGLVIYKFNDGSSEKVVQE